MSLALLGLIGGLVFIIGGANSLVAGATAIARRSGISDMVIGMTVVAIGTSAPEMVVSFLGAADGNSDIAAGNVIGSNICNTLLVLGVTALVLPVRLTKETIRRDIPVMAASTALLCILAADTILGTGSENLISRFDGLILLLLFALFLFLSFRTARKNNSAAEPEVTAPRKGNAKRDKSLLKSILLTLLGLGALIVGGEIMVKAATSLAKSLGVPDLVIAATVVAVGTSLPELATSVAAALRKNTGLALGNVVGSNIINILLILGGSALIHPVSLAGTGSLNFIILALSALFMVLCAFTFTKRRLDRAEAVIFLFAYAVYISFLISGR